jgi:hypothetical protein
MVHTRHFYVWSIELKLLFDGIDGPCFAELVRLGGHCKNKLEALFGVMNGHVGPKHV